MQRFLLNALIASFFVAGMFHFINPKLYMWLIPDYIPYPYIVNFLAGVVEVALAMTLIMPQTRKYGAIGVILLMIAFIPAHIHHVQIANFASEQLYINPYVAWIRLLLIHPLLMVWAYWAGFRYGEQSS
jgi:uncharacterized membrane protein